MFLDNEQIKSAVFGALLTKTDGSGVEFLRMNEKQAKAFALCSPDFEKKAYATASVMLDFYTDSEFFAFSYTDATEAASRPWYYFDVLVNGEAVAKTGEETASARCGSLRVALPNGTNRVTLCFPALFKAKLVYAELSDGASFQPVKKSVRALFCGDSITQGYDAKSPSESYVNRIALKKNWEAVNFAVGGACFDERAVTDAHAEANARLVFVSYGTNDWSEKTPQAFSNDCKAFFKALNGFCADKPVFVILPIWRSNLTDAAKTESFHWARAEIKSIAGAYPNVRFVDLWEDIPHDVALYSDGLHPNGKGFAYYADGVLAQIEKYL